MTELYAEDRHVSGVRTIAPRRRTHSVKSLSQSTRVRRSRTEDVDERNRLFAGRDPRQMHFEFYLAMTSLGPCESGPAITAASGV